VVTEPSRARSGATSPDRRLVLDPDDPADPAGDIPEPGAATGRAGAGAAPGRRAPVADRPAAVPDLQVVGVERGEGVDGDTSRILRALRTPALWVDAGGAVLWAHPAMEALRVVRRREVRVPEIARMVDQARDRGQVVQRDMSIRRPGRRQADIRLRVRVAPMEHGAALVLVEDVTEAERLDHVRRDFVANVSHELKTPIGALSLLAEAVVQGAGDADTVEHFAARMITETRRLTTLVNDLMDLSRIEGIDPLSPMVPVAVDDVVAQACDDARLLAQEKGIQFLRGGVAGLRVLGVEPQLTTAVRNLIVNAINYSAPGTKVAVTTGVTDGSVTIAVTDQGIGIPPQELDRIFERFYRVDQARSRDTGGTGLGLAIVKHVCANHGGDCEVWSRRGEGSTFTIRLPELTESELMARARRGKKEES
jgi:two-component system sensor histidine kinase SenX3